MCYDMESGDECTLLVLAMACGSVCWCARESVGKPCLLVFPSVKKSVSTFRVGYISWDEPKGKFHSVFGCAVTCRDVGSIPNRGANSMSSGRTSTVIT